MLRGPFYTIERPDKFIKYQIRWRHKRWSSKLDIVNPGRSMARLIRPSTWWKSVAPNSGRFHFRRQIELNKCAAVSNGLLLPVEKHQLGWMCGVSLVKMRTLMSVHRSVGGYWLEEQFTHIPPSVNWTRIENIRLFLWNVIIFQHFHFHLSFSAIYRLMRSQRPRPK